MHVAPEEGRELSLVGDRITLKLTGTDTNNALLLGEEVTPPGGGTPPHVHRHEDETFCVLEGEFEFALGDTTIRAATVVLGSAQLRTGAQTGNPLAAGQRFVGAWRLTFDTPVGASQSLLSIMADGTVLFSGQPVKPAAGGVPVTFISAGHGVWEQTGSATAAATWVGFVSDGEGNFLAAATDSVEATLSADGDSWSGRYSATVADPSGNVLYVGGATVEATRITVQPLATPAGTPAAQRD